jgi:3D (Asp-Asp-Asp) domain-containing protein
MKIFLGLFLATWLAFNTIGTPTTYSATAYCLTGKMANGQKPHRGAIATYGLPLGTKVHLDAGKYTGEYIVKDRGVYGKRIDIWVPSRKEALGFGRRPVKLTVTK